jgi:hypothetical protein
MANVSSNRVLEWLTTCAFPAWAGVELEGELTIERSVEKFVSKRV